MSYIVDNTVDENWLVTDLHEPQTPEQMRKRSFWFATALGIDCANVLTAYANYCQNISNGSAEEQLKSIVSIENGRTVDKEGNDFLKKREIAVKEMICQSIFMTLLEQGGIDAPEWMSTFAMQAWQAADRIYAEPTSKEVMDKYKDLKTVEDNAQATSASICLSLGLGNSKEDAMVRLGWLLQMRRKNRMNLLHTALSARPQELERKILEA